MKIDARGIDKFLRAPPAGLRAALVFGPDEGLVRERAEALARTVCPDLRDPFRVADLGAQALADDPARLADEAAAIAMTGGQRVVRVRGFAGLHAATSAKLGRLLAEFIDDPPGDALVVIEAGELDGRSALRKAFDAAGNAAAIACYADEGEALAKLVRAALAAEKVRAGDETVDWLVARFGGDRGVIRSELAKLALYVGAGNEATLDDARAVVGDVGEPELDATIRAAAEGEAATLAAALARLADAGTSPIMTLRAAQRHFARLRAAAEFVDEGLDPRAALGRLRPPVFWKEQDSMLRQLRRWPVRRARQAAAILLDAEIAAKSGGGVPADLVVERALFRVAAAAR